MQLPSPYPLAALLHLFYPRYCLGCLTDLSMEQNVICAACEYSLPATGFEKMANNPVENIFHGRLNLQAGSASYFFSKDSLLQDLMFALKYRHQKEVGTWLGLKMGSWLAASKRFNRVDYIIPLPLHPEKILIRGYNQAQLIADGISRSWKKPVLSHAIVREKFTNSQTKQNRDNRWLNMQNVFTVRDPKLLKNRHCLLVDDVITTGATLEACGKAILGIEGCQISIATAAFTPLIS
ncbi:MAG: ComF family protein [Bacteroidota bacterium]